MDTLLRLALKVINFILDTFYTKEEVEELEGKYIKSSRRRRLM